MIGFFCIGINGVKAQPIIFESDIRIDIRDNEYIPSRVYCKITFTKDSIIMGGRFYSRFYSRFYIENVFSDSTSGVREMVIGIINPLKKTEYWILRGDINTPIELSEVIEIHYLDDPSFGTIFVNKYRKKDKKKVQEGRILNEK
jgi:hypothetical protein